MMPAGRPVGQSSLEQTSQIVGGEARIAQDGSQGPLLELPMHRDDHHMPRAEFLQSDMAPASTHEPPTISLKRLYQAPT
jgi:hypothetical protein